MNADAFRSAGGTLIRPETPHDHPAIAAINRAAFGGETEALLIDRLRTEGKVIASLVAEDPAQQIVGHVLFSKATIEGTLAQIEVASLAPMAVLPPHQRSGI